MFLSLYLCVCAYICEHLFISASYMGMHIHVFAYTEVSVCVCVCVHACVCACACVYVCLHMRVYLSVCWSTCLSFLSAYMCLCSCVCISTCMHMNMPLPAVIQYICKDTCTVVLHSTEASGSDKTTETWLSHIRFYKQKPLL